MLTSNGAPRAKDGLPVTTKQCGMDLSMAISWIYADRWDWVISWQVRIFKNSTTVTQWRGKVCKICSNHMIDLSSWTTAQHFYGYQSRIQGLWQSTNSWCFNKYHDVCTVAPRAKCERAISRVLITESSASHAVKAPVSTSLPSLLMRSRRARNLFALLVLERLLIEQGRIRHEWN